MIEKAKELELLFKQVQREIKKREKLSDKAFNMSTQNSTKRQIDNTRGDLIESSRHIERLRKQIARSFNGSFFDVDKDEAISNTSGFHEYKI